MKIGVDWGGTKIEAVLIDPQNGTEVNRVRVDSPQGDYEEILLCVVDLIKEIYTLIKESNLKIFYKGKINHKTTRIRF